MRTTRLNLLLCLGLLAAFGLACNFSATTANISSLKLGKDQAASRETSSFGANDTVYAVATISNVPDKVKVRGRLVIVEVEGEQPGPVPGLETTLDLAGSGTATFTFTPPQGGWSRGKHRIEVFMLDDSGQQKDQKSADFTIS